MIELLSATNPKKGGVTGRIINVPKITPLKTYQRFPAQTLISLDGQRAAFCAPYDLTGSASIFTFATVNGLMTQRDVYSDIISPNNSQVLTYMQGNGDLTAYITGGYSFNTENNRGFLNYYTTDHQTKTWTRSQITSPNPTSNGYFGAGYAFAKEGDYLIATAPGENGNAGRVYAFNKLGASWTEYMQINLTASNGQSGLTRMARNRSVFTISEPAANRIFVFRGYPEWYRSQTITMPNLIPNSNFGGCVEISDDGELLLISATAQANGGSTRTGAVYIYKFDVDAYALVGTILPPTNEGDLRTFGANVKLSGDKSYALIASVISGATQGYVMRYNIASDYTASKAWTVARGRPDSYFAMDLARDTSNWFIGDFYKHEVIYGD